MAGEWRSIAFGQLLAEPVRNGIYKQKEFHGRGAKIVNMGELFAHPRLRAVPMKRVEISDSESDRFTLAKGDLLFARRSLVAEGAGKCSVVLDIDEPTTFESSIIRARPDRTKADSLFLYYFFNSRSGLHCLDTIRRQVAVAGITGSDLARLEITLPPFPQQCAIAHVLGTLDDKIELNRRVNETLEAMARALFKSWFVDFDPVRAKAEGRDPGLPKPLADIFPARLVDSELGEIPEGWEVRTLGMLGELTIGGDWGEDEAFAGAVEACCLRGVDLEHLRRYGQASAPRRWFKPSSLERRAMDDRDVLVAGSGAGPTGRPLWMCADLVQALGLCVYSNFCKRIRCDTAAKAVYLDAWLHTIRESGEIWEHVNGTSVPNLDANSLLAGKEIPLPPVPVVDWYHDFVRPIWQELHAGKNRTLAALRDSLLPRLVSGELRVKDAESFVGSAV
jgi:type I restriction enzyme S subunit